jgi:hypothetical protein
MVQAQSHMLAVANRAGLACPRIKTRQIGLFKSHLLFLSPTDGFQRTAGDHPAMMGRSEGRTRAVKPTKISS